jgi:hypothetical protein
MIVVDDRQAITTYEVYMQNDVNTKGCTQWFYFSVENKGKGKAKFCLMNFVLLWLFSTRKLLCIKEE